MWPFDYFKREGDFGLVFNNEHDNDPRNLRYEELMPLGGDLEVPVAFELPLRSFTLNQGRTSSCTAHATVHALNIDNGKEASARHLFWKIKTRSEFPSSQLGWGAYMRDPIICLIKEGASDYEFAPNESTESDAAYLKFKENYQAAASQYDKRGGRYVYVTDGTMDNFRKMDAIIRFIWEQRRPVVIGVEWRGSFNAARSGGVIPAIAPSGSSSGHAITAIGWKKINNHLYLVCLNSWGSGWGDDGRVYLPQGFVKISSALGVIRDIEVPKPPVIPDEERNFALEKAKAEELRKLLYEKFPLDVPGDARARNMEARALAGRMWLVLVPAITYRGWTKTDVINHLYARSRNKLDTVAFDLDFTTDKSSK